MTENTADKDMLRWLHALYRGLAPPARRLVRGTGILFAIASLCLTVASILPIKIVLLLAAEGTPEYFQGIVSPGYKDAWLIALTVVTLVSFVTSFVAEALAARSLRHRVAEMGRQNPKVQVVRNETEQLVTRYTQLSRMFSGVILSGLLLVLGLAFMTSLFLILGIILAAQIGWSILKLERLPLEQQDPWLQQVGKRYLPAFVPANFAIFFLILLQYLLFKAGMNVFLAIASLILGRQLLASVKLSITQFLMLASARDQVERTMLGNCAQVSDLSIRDRAFLTVVERQARNTRLAEILGVPRESVYSCVLDSARGDLSVVDVRIDGDEAKRYREYIYENASRAAHDEGLLLRNMDATRLGLPELVSEYELPQFMARLFRLPGEAATPEDDEWYENCVSALTIAWSTEPPDALTEIFLRTRPPLRERLSNQRLSILEVTLGTDAEITAYKQLMDQMNEIRERLERLPDFVFHGSFAREHLLIAGDNPIVLAWGAWSIEPVGVGLHLLEPMPGAVERAIGKLHGSKRCAAVSENDLLLASRCWQLERAIAGRRFGIAHQLMGQLVDSVAREDAASVQRVAPQQDFCL